MRILLPFTFAVIALAGCGKDDERPEPAAASTAASAVVPASPDPGTAPPTAAAEAPSPSAARGGAPANAAESAGSASGTYTVVRGDTLSGIARKHGVSATDLASWNNVSDPRRLRIGQELRLTAP